MLYYWHAVANRFITLLSNMLTNLNLTDIECCLKAFTREVGGYPFLYADTFMTREEFDEMFDLTLYDRVRRAYGAEGAFPHLYEKIRPEVDVFAVLDEERRHSSATQRT